MAFYTSLLAHGIGPGDVVITTPFTFIASANSVLFTGARPVFVDIDLKTFNIPPIYLKSRSLRVQKRSCLCTCMGKDAIWILSWILPSATTWSSKTPARVIEHLIEAIELVRSELVCSSIFPTQNITSGKGGVITADDHPKPEKVSREVISLPVHLRL